MFDISVGSEELQAMSSLKNFYSSYDQLNAVYLLTDELSKDLPLCSVAEPLLLYSKERQQVAATRARTVRRGKR